VVLGWMALLDGKSNAAIAGGALTLGLGAYLGLMWMLKMPELRGMVRVFASRVNRS